MPDSPEIKFKELPEPTTEENTKIKQVFEVDTRFGIIMTIDNFGSLNIKKLARILGKNEATIYHHIKWLIAEPALLSLDQQKTIHFKGKFYMLSPMAKRYRHILGLITSSDEENQSEGRKETEKVQDVLSLPRDQLLKLHNRLAVEFATEESITKEKQLMTYNHVLEDIMLANYEQAVLMTKAGRTPKNPDYPFGALSNFTLDMKITTIRHLYRVVHLMAKLTEEFKELKEEIAQEIEGTPEEQIIDLHFHVVGGEIAEFEFEE